MTFTDAELDCFFDSMRKRDRGVVFNRAMGWSGIMTIGILTLPLLLVRPVGFRIGQFLELPVAVYTTCSIAVAGFALLMIGLLLPRYVKWKLRSYLREALRNGYFQPCPVCKSIETAEDTDYCQCGCLLRPRVDNLPSRAN